jgi:hypothetical protein
MDVKEKEYNQLIAVDLKDWIKEIEQNPPPITGFSTSRLEYLIHLILSHKQKSHKRSYSILNMQYMLNVIPKANLYLDFLSSNGIIEWKNYSAGRNSRLYRLLNEGKTELQPITDKKLILRIIKNKKSLSARNSKKYPDLNKWIYKVEIDWEEALKTIEFEFQHNNKSAEWRTFALGSIERIRAGEIFITVNTTNNRLDSNITNLPKELLPHITINGEHLIEMDISNSQPFFSACLFNPTPKVEQVMEEYLGKSLIMVVKSLTLYDYKDVKTYCSLVISGKFYEYMMDKFKENNIPFENRSDVKDQLFVVLFGKINADKYSPTAKLFKKEFPNVQRLFDLIKKKNHNRLSILLTRIESYVMLKEVAKSISKELPEQPFLTKHDSILPIKLYVVGSNNTDKINKIFIKTVNEITGNIPPGRMRRLI